jgi:arylsulfatase A-like enzyme
MMENFMSLMLLAKRGTPILFLMAFAICCPSLLISEERLPNVIFVMADDLGYGDLGCYGQKIIRTPNLDQMAREGMRFRQFYAGNTVCAPSRCVLMTGLHMGHAHVRGNAGGDMSIQSLRDSDFTVGELFQAAGYRTSLCGKWGLGDDLEGARTGLPRRQGFDHFYGYLNQLHAHNYYPDFLWRNEEKVSLKNVVTPVGQGNGGFRGGYATKRIEYSHDLILDEALGFIRENHEWPFFLYLPLTIPHANNEGTRGTGNGQEVPSLEPYSDQDWSDQDKGQAAMITRMDAGVGSILDLLKELKIDDHTLVMFTSDNGPHDEGGHETERFVPAGPLRGMKRDLYEGGIRVPLIVRWPGVIPANSITDHVAYFGDLMATAAELTEQPVPPGRDSISFLPTLLGNEDSQVNHSYLYWEFYEQGSKQATRFGDWKAVRTPIHTGEIEIFDLKNDLGEARNIAAEHPELVEQAEQIFNEAHVPHPSWKARGGLRKTQPKPGDGIQRF